jgi:hypothetical protein
MVIGRAIFCISLGYEVQSLNMRKLLLREEEKAA